MSLCPPRGHHLYIHLWISCLSARARTHAHTSIFKHAASAWRRDTTLEPKHIEGHSEIASDHTQGSRVLFFGAPSPSLHTANSGSVRAFLCLHGRVLLLHRASQHVLDRRAAHRPSGGNMSEPAESFRRHAIVVRCCSSTVVNRISNLLWSRPVQFVFLPPQSTSPPPPGSGVLSFLF